MAGYDYNSLSPFDFERLCCALLAKLKKRRFQRFGEGRDDGIDLQFDGGPGDLRVYQCKRYRHTANLMSVLRKDEVGKVQSIKPNVYGIMTSASLTPGNKKEIKALFHPYLQSSQDIYGPREIDDLLDRKECFDIVRNISALWLPSFSVVSSIFNNGILGRSEDDINVLMKECTKWTWTKATRKGQASLEKHHVAIFIGDPGVGKTVSAKLLLCQSCLEGYQPIITYDKIEDFESVYDPKRKQVFFFDDFLGQNYFEVISNRADTKVCRFIERVRGDPNKRFLLTSRTTILNRGYECSVAFRSSDFKSHAYLVDTNEQTEEDRAHVLYMNLYHADCLREELRSVLSNKKYRRILRHKNFSPRIVGYILEARSHRQELGGTSLFDCLLKALNDPREVWKTVYDNQLNPLERVLLWCVFLCARLDEGALNECFDVAKENMSTASAVAWGTLTFTQTAKTLSGALLSRIMYSEDKVTYELLNPSIADYLISNWQNDVSSVKTALAILRNRKATVKFFEFSRNNPAATGQRNNVVRYLAALPLPEDGNSALALVSNREMLMQDKRDAERIWDRIAAIEGSEIPNGSVDDWASILSMFEHAGKDVSSVVLHIPPDVRGDLMGRCLEFEAVAALYQLFIRHGGSVPSNAGEIITAALATDAYEFARDLDAPDLELKEDGYMGLSDADYESMQGEIKDYALKKAVSSMIPMSLIDMNICLENINLDEMFQCKPEDYYGDDEFEERYDRVSDIDALFDGLLNEPQ